MTKPGQQNCLLSSITSQQLIHWEQYEGCSTHRGQILKSQAYLNTQVDSMAVTNDYAEIGVSDRGENRRKRQLGLQSSQVCARKKM